MLIKYYKFIKTQEYPFRWIVLGEFSPSLYFSLSEKHLRGDPTVQQLFGYHLMLDTWKTLTTPLSEPYKYRFSLILDDRIIGSWCLGVLNVQFNLCNCVQCFDQSFGMLIDLKSQHSHISNWKKFRNFWILKILETLWHVVNSSNPLHRLTSFFFLPHWPFFSINELYFSYESSPFPIWCLTFIYPTFHVLASHQSFKMILAQSQKESSRYFQSLKNVVGIQIRNIKYLFNGCL